MKQRELFEDSVFGFHAQQSAEKALKAWLSLRGTPYPKTHDLRVLLRLLELNKEPGWEQHVEIVDLTDFAVQFRYDFPILPEELDRGAILFKIETLLLHVEGLLGLAD